MLGVGGYSNVSGPTRTVRRESKKKQLDPFFIRPAIYPEKNVAQGRGPLDSHDKRWRFPDDFLA